jgi:hypothetical protein
LEELMTFAERYFGLPVLDRPLVVASLAQVHERTGSAFEEWANFSEAADTDNVLNVRFATLGEWYRPEIEQSLGGVLVAQDQQLAGCSV